MTVRGKGVLRLAIEDFFTTTKIGLWLSSWFVQFGEKFEDMIASHYKDLWSDILSDPSIPESIKSLGRGSGNGNLQGGIGQAVGFAVGTGSQAAGSFLAPLFQTLNYKMARKVLQYRLDPQAIIAGLWRTPEYLQILKDDGKDLGIHNDRLRILIELMRPRANENSLLSGWLRGIVPDAGLVAELKARGWDDSSIGLFKKLTEVIPPVSDLISMSVREAFSPDIVARWNYDEGFPSEILEHTRKQGLSDEWVKKYWYAHWQLPSPQMGFEMLHRLRPGKTSKPFTADDLDTLLRTADYPKYYRDRLAEISYSPFTRVDVRRMYKTGELSYDEVIESYKDIGYSDEKAKLLADFTIHYELTDTTNLIDDYSELSRGLIQTAYKAGLISEGEFREALSGMGIVEKAQDLIVSITELKTQVDNIPDYTKEYRTDLKNIIEKSYVARLIDKQTALDALTGLSISIDQANLLLANADLSYLYGNRSDAINLIGKLYTGYSIDRGQAVSELGKHNVSGAEQGSILAEWDRLRDYRSRKLTQSQYQKAWINGLLTDEDYKDNLRGLGYTDFDIELLILMQTNPEEGE